jgi:predicted lipoprotein with Yx(FWY)xxD motif
MKMITTALAVAGLAIAGCGGGSSYGGGSSNSSSNAGASGSTAPTLYTFSKDTMGKSNCSGACANNWPPAASAPGIDGKITKIKRSDGTTQVALDGHPLYRYVADKKPGDANGNGLNAFGGLWKTAGSSASSAPMPSRSGY